MNDEYIRYWGLTQHPFLLAPDGNMMCVTGQYFECFERLRYAISTNKGGVLIASEDPGLGKTTILLKLIADMKEEYGQNFKHAYIDHPTLTADQMIGQITGLITGEPPSDDKLRNLVVLKNALIEAKNEGSKSIIVIDEGQMLCDSRDVLQELRVLINLTHNNEYLHTFIFSGQRALWDTLQEIPEFWQRLPVRYYFAPLRFEETRELIRYRLNKAGLDVAREIFTEDAIEMIHKYSKGLPRTVIAISDLALLNGYNDKARKVSFKEVSKAINSMSGRGDSLPHPLTKQGRRGNRFISGTTTNEPLDETVIAQKSMGYFFYKIKQAFFDQSPGNHMKPVTITLVIALLIFIGAAGHRLFSSPKQTMGTFIIKEVEKPVLPVKDGAEKNSQEEFVNETTKGTSGEQLPSPNHPDQEKDVIAAFKEDLHARREMTVERSAIINVSAANVRSAPDLEAPRILTVVRGEIIPVIDERTDSAGMKWYKVSLYGERTGWIAEIVANVTAK